MFFTNYLHKFSWKNREVNTTKLKLSILIAIILLLASCSTIGPTLQQHNWNCGPEITAETKTRNCKRKEIYMSEYSYYGSIQPVNYSEGVPDGEGVITNTSTGEIIQTIHSLGSLKFAEQKLSDGSTFKGKMSPAYTWMKGEYKTDKYSFNGSFTYAGNKLRKGKIVWRNGNSFNGTFGDTEKPKKGQYSYFALNCTTPVIYDGSFDGKTLSNLNTKKSFSIKHPIAKIKGWNGRYITFDFTESSLTDKTVNSYETDIFYSNLNTIKSIRSSESFLKLNELDLSVSESSLSWDNLYDCNSYPKFLAKSNYLETTTARYIIFDDDISINTSDLNTLGFEVANKIYQDEKNSQYLIFTVKNRDYNRNVISKDSVSSKYISGQKEVYNSKYDTASLNVANAQAELTRAKYADSQRQSRGCAGTIWECALAEALLNETSSAQTAYNKALATLSNTPRILTQDIISEYDVQKLNIKASKSVILELAFIDVGRKQMHKKEYPIDISKDFEVINSPIAKSDTNMKRLMSGASKENEVDDWMNEKIPFKTSLTNLLDEIRISENLERKRKSQLINYFVSANKNKPLRSSSKQVVKQNKLPSKNKDYVIEDSILIVKNLQGMGTGFYVTNEYVITNQHVVEDSGFVTLKDFNNKTFTGKVIATDIATDLALISVTEYKVPLELESQCSVRRRENVFTVGHPEGLEYSTTRGIVSAIRVMPSPFYSAVGDKKYIQIDAAISGGNSGGPLLNSSEKVIGVNTLSKIAGQNLNFAIHCSEIKNFLSANNVLLN